jgi:hypothetical protein
MYQMCSSELGRPKDEVMEEIYRYKSGCEFDTPDVVSASGTGVLDMDGDLDKDREKKMSGRRPTSFIASKKEKDIRAQKLIEYEVANYIDKEKDMGHELDEDLIRHMDELLEGDESDAE